MQTNDITLIDRTLSLGLLHAAASELLIRRAMQMHERSGHKVKHEAKRAFNDLQKAYERMQYCYDRVQDIATSKDVDENSVALVDAFISDSSNLAMITMLYMNATNEQNKNWEANAKQILQILRNLTLADTQPIFALDFIKQFAPKI